MKTLLALCAVAAIAAAPTVASAQLSTGVSIAGGIALPSGDGSDQTENGYNAALGLHLGAPLLPVGVRIEGGFNAFEAKGNTSASSASLKILSGTVNATFGLGLPYVIGGLGYYNARAKLTSGTTTFDETESAVGFNGGVGLNFPLGVMSTFAEVRYHKAGGNLDLSYIPITFGIKF